MATLKQVAEKAGVSRKTVYRVLNQSGSVKPETAQRVRMALKALDYRPDETGQILAAKKKKLQLVFCSIKGETAPAHEEIRKSAQEKAKDLEKLGVRVDFYTMDRENPLTKEEGERLIEELSCDGMAVVGEPESIIMQLVDRAEELGIPMVFYNIDDESRDKICYVGCDYEKSGRIAAGLLGICDSRCKVGIFTVGGSKAAFSSPNYKERVKGFLDEIEKHYPQVEVAGQYLLSRNIFDCYEEIRNVMQDQQDMDAVYLVNPGNYIACEAIRKLAGGREIKIITNDLTPRSSVLLKQGVITAAISQDTQSQGALPLQILFELLVFGRQPEWKKCYTELQIFISQSM